MSEATEHPYFLPKPRGRNLEVGDVVAQNGIGGYEIGIVVGVLTNCERIRAGREIRVDWYNAQQNVFKATGTYSAVAEASRFWVSLRSLGDTPYVRKYTNFKMPPEALAYKRLSYEDMEERVRRHSEDPVDSALFLPTHPVRRFGVGDIVCHNGEGKSYRGRTGRVMTIDHTKKKLCVRFDDTHDTLWYSIAWSKKYLRVSLKSLNDTRGFNGEEFVEKYKKYARCAKDLETAISIGHSEMKLKVDARTAMKEIDDCIGTSLVEANTIANMKFPVMVMDNNNPMSSPHQIIANVEAFKTLPAGCYTVYQDVRHLEVKNEQKTFNFS
jgi:hypothetical protein